MTSTAVPSSTDLLILLEKAGWSRVIDFLQRTDDGTKVQEQNCGEALKFSVLKSPSQIKLWIIK